jgi:hypothetical protein
VDGRNRFQLDQEETDRLWFGGQVYNEREANIELDGKRTARFQGGEAPMGGVAFYPRLLLQVAGRSHVGGSIHVHPNS